MNKELQKRITAGFKPTKLTVRFGEGWVNVARPDGVHCEFYPCWGKGAENWLTGTYTIDDAETTIDLHVPSQIDEFVSVCQKILTF